MPGPVVDRLGAIARASTACTSSIGVIERDGGTLYCTALFFGPTASCLGKHRKLMPTGAGAARLGRRRRLDDAGLRHAARPLGAVICWENYMPLLRMAMYAKGIQL